MIEFFTCESVCPWSMPSEIFLQIFEMEIWIEREVVLIIIVSFIVHYIDHVVLYMV